MPSESITIDRLHSVLLYDAETGLFTNLVKRGSRAMLGEIAGSPDTKGYIIICIDGVDYRAHRLAWFYCFGEWPREEIDHKDEDKSNNRLGNLRDVSPLANRHNVTGATKNSRFGLRGVAQVGSKFQAQIYVGGKAKYLGIYETSELAQTAYLTAKALLHTPVESTCQQ